MPEIMENFELSKEMSEIAVTALMEVCRLADKYDTDRNLLVVRFLAGLIDTSEKSDFSNLPVDEEGDDDEEVKHNVCT